ncbi:SRPBCC family protein [Actinomycetospora soli]|uniref:SRPBCC family protein n=1 Tax=Actinomycetospora soli TaxID=2893887 RepID=UPI001E37327D|nr:SRPBCC family protein [Actinomycetospora soli]MCD2186760.1 SRPBCC family protein [Actinomycetospora soli]
MTDTRLEASRVVDARPDQVFALLTTPDRHSELDASGTVRGSRTHRPVTGVGDVFEMDMHGRDMGDYVVDNHVVTFEPDAEIAWAPATHGGDRGGQVWGYRLEACNGGGSTRVTHTYDWSGVTLERLLPYLPVVDADGLAATLDRVAAAVEQQPA